jgi:hypothetical protein
MLRSKSPMDKLREIHRREQERAEFAQREIYYSLCVLCVFVGKNSWSGF